jgi:hypothetical protein
MAQFSGTIKLTDLNDFIAPSQACVVSLQGAAPDAKPPMQLLEEVRSMLPLHATPRCPRCVLPCRRSMSRIMGRIIELHDSGATAV